ncbi:MAG: thioesterase family protein [Hyphomonadaceae bacterium]|nr:thioesterase family protein [Hyphomonadaceae bacterium]
MSAAVSLAPLLPAPLYQGSVNTWECDEGGHLNVRFHIERLTYGLMHFTHALAMPRAFTPGAMSTLAPLDLHMRFHREALPPGPLSMHGAVTQIGEDDITLCCDMRHPDGAYGTTFTLRAAHVETSTEKRFAWSSRTRAAAEALKRPLPAHAAPRSIDLTRTPCEASRARAAELGAMRIGATGVTPDQCDAFGRLRIEHFFGRVSDSVPWLLANYRRGLASSGAVMPAGAVVEARIAFRKRPRVGDLIEIHSGVVELFGKTMRIVHWLCDPISGGAWATFEVVALSFDKETRKAIEPTPSAREAIAKQFVKLTI